MGASRPIPANSAQQPHDAPHDGPHDRTQSAEPRRDAKENGRVGAGGGWLSVPADPAFRQKLHARLAAKTRADKATGCLLFIGARRRSGKNVYGKIRVGAEIMPAHRVAYELAVGPVPKGMVLDHLCRQPACCNPLHLEPVTNAENLRRAPVSLDNRMLCAHGHVLAIVGVEVSHDRRRKYRRCRACRRLRNSPTQP